MTNHIALKSVAEIILFSFFYLRARYKSLLETYEFLDQLNISFFHDNQVIFFGNMSYIWLYRQILQALDIERLTNIAISLISTVNMNMYKFDWLLNRSRLVCTHCRTRSLQCLVHTDFPDVMRTSLEYFKIKTGRSLWVTQVIRARIYCPMSEQCSQVST